MMANPGFTYTEEQSPVISDALLKVAFENAYAEISTQNLSLPDHLARIVARTREQILESFPNEKDRNAAEAEFNSGARIKVRNLAFEKTIDDGATKF